MVLSLDELAWLMHMTPSKTRRRNAGISLLEIMVVLGIMALVIGVVAPRAIDYFGRAKSQTAGIQMQQIKGGLQLMYVDIGRYPTEAEGLEALVNAPAAATGWHGPYLDTNEGLIDPWGRRYLYRFPGADRAFDVLSLGRDGQVGGSGEDEDISL